MLVGPGLAPRAAARMLAVSRGKAAIFAAAGFSPVAFAAAGFAAAAFAAGFAAGFSEGAGSPLDFWRAIFMISATLGRPPPLPTAAFTAGLAGGSEDPASTGGEASASGAGAASCWATASASPPAPPAFWARAAARISATDIFFRSAMLLTLTRARDYQTPPFPAPQELLLRKDRSPHAGWRIRKNRGVAAPATLRNPRIAVVRALENAPSMLRQRTRCSPCSASCRAFFPKIIGKNWGS